MVPRVNGRHYGFLLSLEPKRVLPVRLNAEEKQNTFWPLSDPLLVPKVGHLRGFWGQMGPPSAPEQPPNGVGRRLRAPNVGRHGSGRFPTPPVGPKMGRLKAFRGRTVPENGPKQVQTAPNCVCEPP